MVSKSQNSSAAKSRKGQAALSTTSQTWTPHCIYIYYLTQPQQDHAEVRGFLYDNKSVINPNTIDQLITSLAQKIKSSNYADLVFIGNFFAQTAWARHSYLAVVLEHATQRLTPNNIEFVDSSHTLLNEAQVSSMPSGLSGVRYENHVLRRGNIPWNKMKLEEESFPLNITFGTVHAAIGLSYLTHNDSGTNLGPPSNP